MGLLSKLGGAIKETARGAAVNGILNATGNGAMTGAGNSAYEYDANGHIKGVNSSYVSEVESRYAGSYADEVEAAWNGKQFADGKFGGLATSTPRQEPTSTINEYPLKYGTQRNKTASTSKENSQSAYGLLLNDKGSNTINDYNNNKIAEDPISDIIQLKLPDWNYADFINERAIWQKGLSSIFDEPAWFYFKIFFDFNTNHGLFGGLLNSSYLTSATNSAAKYLYTVRKFHVQEKPKDRINALYKFASILSYINTNAPWYFKSIKNLNNAAIPVINEYSKEKFIEIETSPDAIDMRLSTLMSLYSYACYDTLLGKEIIPANLRKFNMTIILFQTPLRYLHTSYITNEKMEFMGVNLTGVANMFGGKNKKFDSVNYKSMNPSNGQNGNFGDTMSMHAFTFYGCEFDINSLGNMIPSQMNNETPFQLGANTIRINYTSCMQHTMNEFYAMMYGSDGFYFNQYSNFQLNDWNGYVNNNKETWGKQEARYKTLSNLFENIMSGGTILGLVDKPTTYKRAIDATEALMNGLYEDNNILKDIGTNFALGLLGSSQNTDAPQGNLYGDYGINSAYFKDKVEMLKNGVHERTTAPYYYDPDTGVRHDLHVDKHYSAYEFKNDVNAISSFNVTNWLDTTTQKFASKLNDVGRDFLDTIGGNHISTTAPYRPNPYNKETANQLDAKKFEGVGKSHDMVDDPNDWNRVEQPYAYDPQKAVNYENSKAGKPNKIQIMVDEIGNPINQVTEKPFNYEPINAVNYENSKAGDVGKIQDMVDKIGNDEHQVTEKPFNYEPMNAVDYENSKAGDVGKIQDMVDKIGNDEHQVTEKPFNYEPMNAVDYENSKAGGEYKTQILTDGIGNPEHEMTEAPFDYNPMNAVNYENSKAGGEYKTQVLTDGIGNQEHEMTEAPFDYNPMNAVNYENSKAGGEGKSQLMTDGIGNAEHEMTKAPFDYDPMNAVNYENSKAGGEGKSQLMTDGIGNAEHEMTEAPFDYEPMNAVNYENSKAGGEGKSQLMTDGIGNVEHEMTEAPFDYNPMNAVNYESSKVNTKIDSQLMTEPPFDYDPMNATNYENSKAGGEGKSQLMTDGIGNPVHQYSLPPFSYDSSNAIKYEQNKKANT